MSYHYIIMCHTSVLEGKTDLRTSVSNFHSSDAPTRTFLYCSLIVRLPPFLLFGLQESMGEAWEEVVHRYAKSYNSSKILSKCAPYIP